MGTDDSKVFSSTDNGSSWTDLTGTGITSSDVHSFAIFNGYLYASAANVLYRRTIPTSINENVQDWLPNYFYNPLPISVLEHLILRQVTE